MHSAKDCSLKKVILKTQWSHQVLYPSGWELGHTFPRANPREKEVLIEEKNAFPGILKVLDYLPLNKLGTNVFISKDLRIKCMW